MSSEYKVSHTYAGGEMIYQVYRTRNENEPDHSGNREVVGTFDSEENAQEYCDVKNGKE